MSSEINIYNPKSLGAPLGQYCHVTRVKATEFLFIAGSLSADKDGNITEQANPNGSLMNIAGICNIDRNIFGMMPHPERASDSELNNQDGKLLFASILNEVLA